MEPQASGSGIVFPCKHIRSKEMYYQSDQMEGDAFSGGVFWCAKTHETFGPDGEPVDRPECMAGRACFEE